MDDESLRPLIREHQHGHADLRPDEVPRFNAIRSALNTGRGNTRIFLVSRIGHVSVLLLVGMDVSCIFADIFINLYICDVKHYDPAWDQVRDSLGIVSLVFSCLFMLELIASIWAFGWRFFQSKFHCFDAAVITLGFIVDVILHGIVEEIASLVVILRLWRIFKIIEELSAGAADQMSVLEERIEQLELEKVELRKELDTVKTKLEEEGDD